MIPSRLPDQQDISRSGSVMVGLLARWQTCRVGCARGSDSDLIMMEFSIAAMNAQRLLTRQFLIGISLACDMASIYLRETGYIATTKIEGGWLWILGPNMPGMSATFQSSHPPSSMKLTSISTDDISHFLAWASRHKFKSCYGTVGNKTNRSKEPA
eukprot:scaffold68803_cov57-Attheya_sp.AAC.2